MSEKGTKNKLGLFGRKTGRQMVVIQIENYKEQTTKNRR
jgi:hypothetical protein